MDLKTGSRLQCAENQITETIYDFAGWNKVKPGRKILNLRRDRGIAQQDLARASGITPGALSKIEAGINEPYGRNLFCIARRLGVPTDYLLDEESAYPYQPPERVQPEGKATTKTRMEVTQEEKMFLKALRDSQKMAQKVAYELPYLSVETLALAHFLVFHEFDGKTLRNINEHFDPEEMRLSGRRTQPQIKKQP